MTNVIGSDNRGTPYYSAPETFYGQVGKASDVWSFGIVLLELYTGKHAWGEVKHHNELLGYHMKEVLPPMMSFLQPQKKTICLLCLSYKPEDRKPIEEIMKTMRQEI